MNRALRENRGLGRTLRFVVLMLQREQQRQIGITIKGPLIRTKIDRTETPDKTVVGVVELMAGVEDMFLAAAVELGTPAIAHRNHRLTDAEATDAIAASVQETHELINKQKFA